MVGKTVGSNADHFTQVNFWVSSGTTNATREGTVGVPTATVNLWDMQCEIGSTVSQLEKTDSTFELNNCKRFYQTGIAYQAGYAAAASQTFGYRINYPVSFRAAPTVASVSPVYSNASGFAASSVLAN